MGYDLRPVSWDGQERPKISARLAQCRCGNQPHAHVDTAGMWGAECHRCRSVYLGDDHLGCETWQELVRGWNAFQRERLLLEMAKP